MAPIARLFPLRKRFAVLNAYNYVTVRWLRLTCGVRFKVEYQGELPDGPCVLVSNHQSEWETLFLQTIKHSMCTVVKRELLDLPIFGWGLRLLQPIPLDRSRPSVALRAVLSIGVERLKGGMSVLIFPEGTRVDAGERKRFNKSGAVIACNTGVPVVPVAHNAGECWPGKTFIKQPGMITVVIGAPIDTSERIAKDIMAEVEEWVDDQLERISSGPYTRPG